MSILLVLLVLGFFLYVFSQFGSKIAAKSSLVWWFISIFLLFNTINPDLLGPIANKLGIQLASNFVMAVVIMFLFLQTLELTALLTEQYRKQRSLVSNLSERESFLAKQGTLSINNDSKALIILPCYNEEENLPLVVPQILSLKRAHPDKIDFVFINDGSSDKSEEVLRTMVPDNLISHPVNIGVSGVLLSGFRLASRLGFGYAIQCDGDGQHPVTEIMRLLEKALEARADIVVGSRFLGSTNQTNNFNLESTTLCRRLGGILLHAALGIFGKAAMVSDPTSGFRVFSRRAFLFLKDEMPDDYPEPETIALLALNNFEIQEIFVKMAPRTKGTSSISGFRSIVFIVKVLTALLGLRLRTLYKKVY